MCCVGFGQISVVQHVKYSRFKKCKLGAGDVRYLRTTWRNFIRDEDENPHPSLNVPETAPMEGRSCSASSIRVDSKIRHAGGRNGDFCGKKIN